MYYQEMVDAIAECGVGYKAPTYDKLRCDLLQKLKFDINDRHQKLRAEWKDTGCTILCDCWSDGRSKSTVVFSATCPKGTIYLRSIDISSYEEDAHYMFALLESVVQEVGVTNVVQVITDSAPARTYAGRLLMDKYPSLFWSPCASHCINKMFEDLGKHEWVKAVLEDASNIVRFIYSNDWILKMMKKFTGGRELIRPKIERCTSNILSLLSLTLEEDNIKQMFCHAEWLSSNYGRRPDAQAIKSLLFLETFWKSAREVVRVFEPLIKLLRVVEGDMPAMGYIYEGIEGAKIAIKEYYKGIEEKSGPFLEIIDRRWNMLVHSPLHAAAAFLNPSIFYRPSFKADARIRNGFQDAMLKMATEDIDKIEITQEHPFYVNAQGALGTELAIKGRTLNAPGDWWAGYGYEIPTLQKYAIRILSQPCSSHWCGWNWNTFDSIRNKSRLELQKFNDLVFVHCNLWLQAIARGRDPKCRPINFDEIDVISEWPTESGSSPPLSGYSWLDNLPLEYR